MSAVFSFAQISGAYPGQRQQLGSYGDLVSFKNIDSLGVIGPDDAAIVAPGSVSYELWLQCCFGGTFATVSAIRLWLMTPSDDGISFLYNGQQVNYQTPVGTASTVATTAIPLADPGSAAPNVSIGGNLVGVLTAPGYSDFICLQMVVASTFNQPYISPPEFGIAYQES